MAWPGRNHDARLHAGSALAAGAAACLMEAQGMDPAAVPAGDERLACMDELKRQAGEVAGVFLGHPSRALQVVAITGTNGKTSSTWWVAQALAALERRCGVVGTLGVGEPSTEFESTGLTTPDAVALQTVFRRFADQGLAACAIEASSIGIVEHRLAGAAVAVAAFTNLTQDHLDYHGTMAAYGAAKRALFDMPGLCAAVLNVDDPQGRAWAEELSARPELDLWTVSPSLPAQTADAVPADLVQTNPPGATKGPVPARLWARHVRHAPEGLRFELCELTRLGPRMDLGLDPEEGARTLGDTSALSGEREDSAETSAGHPVATALIGGFNVENLLVVAACLRSLGVPLADVARTLGVLTPVPGRLQRVPAVGVAPQPAVVVDYAHTPDALDKALQALAPLAAARGGQLWCVFGCGGDRDATKRPLMGRVAVQGAAHVVVTSDNPRSEPPARIVDQVMAGARETAAASAGARTLQALEDRRAAIAHAVRHAAGSDVVLIAGKGHEQTQEIGGLKLPFSDVAEAQAALRARAAIQASGQRDAPSLTGRDARKGVPLPPATSVGEPKA